ncbi:hypothetical protein, partial [Sporolactobacillus terrae]|uniref:hypothetical protein n=1 Tax=Sporolactobacillus terrae TaxID=269673 RepID=UPI00048ABC19
FVKTQTKSGPFLRQPEFSDQKIDSFSAASVQAKGDPADKLRVRGGSWTARGKRAAEVSFKYIVGE